MASSFETHRFAMLLRMRQTKTKRSWVLHILVLGAAGMVGRKLTERLLRDGRLGKRDITRMTLHDVVAPAIESAISAERETGQAWLRKAN